MRDSNPPVLFNGTKYSKYRSRNPLNRFLLRRFYEALGSLYGGCNPQSYLEAGCGEGFVTESLCSLFRPGHVVAFDIKKIDVRDARERLPFADVRVGDVYGIDSPGSAFDMVVCCEVLEHLAEPERALAELARVCRGKALLSVPNEPWWRMLNLARLKYVRALGNTRGHVNHWSTGRFVQLLSSHFVVESVRSPLPWSIVLCRVK